jgi:predicted nucleic acid-binding protein
VIIVDTNIILDVLSDDPRWAEWSDAQLKICAARDRLVINDIIYSELSVGYDSIDEVEEILTIAGLPIEPIPRAALFLAGKMFKRYRENKGTKSGVLPDFFIGAHAAVEGATLLTRDAGRYRRYFPTLTLITPAAN